MMVVCKVVHKHYITGSLVGYYHHSSSHPLHFPSFFISYFAFNTNIYTYFDSLGYLKGQCEVSAERLKNDDRHMDCSGLQTLECDKPLLWECSKHYGNIGK